GLVAPGACERAGGGGVLFAVAGVVVGGVPGGLRPLAAARRRERPRAGRRGEADRVVVGLGVRGGGDRPLDRDRRAGRDAVVAGRRGRRGRPAVRHRDRDGQPPDVVGAALGERGRRRARLAAREDRGSGAGQRALYDDRRRTGDAVHARGDRRDAVLDRVHHAVAVDGRDGRVAALVRGVRPAQVDERLVVVDGLDHVVGVDFQVTI